MCCQEVQGSEVRGQGWRREPGLGEVGFGFSRWLAGQTPRLVLGPAGLGPGPGWCRCVVPDSQTQFHSVETPPVP